MAFKKAQKRDARLRFGLIGPAGSGKTRTALELASRIGKKVAVIDSERGRSRAYSDRFEFDVEDEMKDFSPSSFVAAIKEAEAAGYDVIIVDSASHEWAGKGGVLGIVDVVAAKSNNKFTAWSVGTPAHQTFIDAVLQCRCHIIVTFRAKTEWVLEDDARGKKVPKAVGLGPVARDGTEYEVDFVGLLDMDHRLTITKTTNFSELEGMVFQKPGEDLAQLMIKWLSENTVEPAPSAPSAARPAPAPSAPASQNPPSAPTPEPGGAVCSVCGEPQMSTRSGPVCKNGHGGAPTSAVAPAPALPAQTFASFAERLRGANSQIELDGAASEIAFAVQNGRVTATERGELIKVYIARQEQLTAAKAA